MRGLWIILGLIGAVLILLIASSDTGKIFGLKNDAFAYTFYLGVWAVIVSSAVIPRAGGFAKAARNAVIWLGIILVLTTGYIYRFDLQDLGSRLTAGLIPGSPVSGQSGSGRNQITIIRSRNGQFEAQASVNGSPVSFLVDTGASSVVLSHDDAVRIGLDLSGLSYSVPVSTANGMTEVARMTIGNLAIGEIQRDNIAVMVARQGDLDQSLLGMSYLQTFWSFEIRGDRLILTD